MNAGYPHNPCGARADLEKTNPIKKWVCEMGFMGNGDLPVCPALLTRQAVTTIKLFYLFLSLNDDNIVDWSPMFQQNVEWSIKIIGV